MIPKQKAIQLYNKFNKEITESSSSYEYEKIKEVSPQIIGCCLVAVDELINAFKELSIEESGRIHIDFGHGFWIEVKNEIKIL